MIESFIGRFKGQSKNAGSAVVNSSRPKKDAVRRKPAGLIAVPELPPALANHVWVTARELPKRFDALAVEMGYLTAAAASGLRAAVEREEGWVEDLAKGVGMSDEQINAIVERQGFYVAVDARQGTTARFLTWEQRVRRHLVCPKVETVNAQELAALKQRGKGLNNDEADLQTRALARRLLALCAKVGGNDIHINVREHHTEIQVRVKGNLKAIKARDFELRNDEGERLIRAIYTGLAKVKTDSYNRLAFQDAQIPGEELPDTGLSSVRLARGPIFPQEACGSAMIARLQYRELTTNASEIAAASKELDLRTPAVPEGELRLGKMGLTEKQVAMIVQLIRRPTGVIVVTGPTGSGKTTTLYEMERHRAREFPEKRLVTIEAPVEYPMPWANQISTAPEQFPERLRNVLRWDPDTILLGEIRGAEEGVAMIQAAMTGHNGNTTLHVTDAFGVVPRLSMLDHVRLSPELICDPNLLIGFIAQRLVPLLCPDCKQSLEKAKHKIPEYMMDALKTWGNLSAVHLRGEGCETCHGEGIVGEQAVAEIVVTSEALMTDYIKHGPQIARQNHRKRPGSDKPMIEHALDLVFEGRLSPLDAESRVDAIPFKETA